MAHRTKSLLSGAMSSPPIPMAETMAPVLPRRRYIIPDCLFLYSPSAAAAGVLPGMAAVNAAAADMAKKPRRGNF